MNPENVNDLSLVLCDILLKLNRTGTKFNKRIFCLKDGFIFYYNVPSNFISNNFDSLKGFPNAGIAIIDVLKMYGHHHHKLHCFSIEFPEDKLITYKISKKMNIRRYAINNISEFSNNQINEEKIDNKSIFKIIRWIFSIYPSDNKAKPLKFWVFIN